jgi:hypothetical protein
VKYLTFLPLRTPYQTGAGLGTFHPFRRRARQPRLPRPEAVGDRRLDVRDCDSGGAPSRLRLLGLRQARGEAVRRDGIDREIVDLERQVATLPAIVVGEPGAVMAAELVGWLSARAVRLTERDVQRARILGLTTVPALSGLLLGFAVQMGGGCRHRDRAAG